MFPKEISDILVKYQNITLDEVLNINNDINKIICNLKSIRGNLSKELSRLTDNDSIDNFEDEIFQDIKTLRNYINLITFIELSDETIPSFDKCVYPYLVSDDICPFNNEKMKPHLIHYKRRINNCIYDESVEWYKCPVCNKLFVLDIDAEHFVFDNTNIILSDKYYNKILYHDVIVISDINKCSSQDHDIDDLECELPVIEPDGNIIYQTVPISHCITCNRYVMLKSIYDNLSGVPACVIIDETKNKSEHAENQTTYEEKGSKLYQYGYNVNCIENLTPEQRHTILVMQLALNNITKNEIYSILDTNINRWSNRKESKRDGSKAVAKWKEDKEFVKNIDLEKEIETINIGKLILKYKISK